MQVYNTRRQQGHTEHVRIVDDEPTEPAKRSQDTSFLRRHAAFFVIISSTIAVSGLFLIYQTQQDTKRADEFYASQQKSDIDFKNQIASLIEAKNQNARNAETIARTDQPFDESKYFKNLAAKNPGCDITAPDSITVIINKKHCVKDQKWEPSNLVDVDGYQVRADMKPDLTAMMAAATSAGVNFEITSSYRSYADQKALYDGRVETPGNTDVDSTSAKPGFSEHQTGLAVDLKILDCALDCFGTTRRYAWLQENAANYGFIERYPKSLGEITGYTHEPWHWRYVGKKVALDMKKLGIQTLEMYFGVSGGDYYPT